MDEPANGHMLKAAIHGCGRIAGARDLPDPQGRVTTHAQAYLHLEGISLAGVSDRTPGRASDFGSVWGVDEAFDSLSELLSVVKPDVLSLCSKNSEHADDLVECLEHPDCPNVILAEKPLCLDPSEADRIEAARTARTVALLVNHSRRFDPLHRELSSRIRRGEFGHLVSGNAWYYGGWQNNGTHLVDTVRMLLGSVTDWSDARPSFAGREGDPCLDATLWIGNAPIRVEGVPESNYQLFEYEFRFEKARLRFENFGSRVRCERVEVNEIDERELTDCDKYPWNAMSDPLYHAVEAAAETARSRAGVDLQSDLSDALQTMRLIWDISSSLQP